MATSNLTPNERSMRAKLAAHASWANTRDPAARTKPARDKALERFEVQVDPEGILSPEERARRAEHARKAYFTALALKSAKARRLARESTVTESEDERSETWPVAS